MSAVLWPVTASVLLRVQSISIHEWNSGAVVFYCGKLQMMKEWWERDGSRACRVVVVQRG